jgi:cellobiose phosphorylase
LYALRGALAAGQTQRAMDFLTQYSNRRLLGDHVPYPIEWGPGGNQPHLAAESALYCRVYTEGLLGIRPTGLRSFNMTPALPKTWDSVKLRNMHGFGAVLDLALNRARDKLQLQMVLDGKRMPTRVVEEGKELRIDLSTRN